MRVLNYITLVALLVALAGCFGGSNQSGEVITIYSPHGDDLLAEFKQRYEAAHPGVRVEYLDMGSQQVLERIRGEKANPNADIWWGAPQNMFINAAKEGLLEAYKPSWVDAVDPLERDAQYRWVGTFHTPQVILYNENKIPVNEVPSDWDELLDAKWKDKIAIRYPMASGGMRGFFGAIMQRESRGKSEEAGYAWLARLDANTLTYPTSPSLMFEEITRGDAVLSIWNLVDVFLEKKLRKRPFNYSLPKSGTLVITDAIAIVKGCKNPEGARSFYEFVTSIESFSVQANQFYRIPCRTDIPPEKLPEWMRSLHIPRMDVDWDSLSANSEKWMNTWDNQIKKRGQKWLEENQ
jgi:iron(III) transport system substrate-binding protein